MREGKVISFFRGRKLVELYQKNIFFIFNIPLGLFADVSELTYKYMCLHK